MTDPDGEHQDPVVERLAYLLQRARDVKPGTSIDPPLQVSELVPENESLLGEIEGEKEARSLAVDTAAKSLFYANLVNIVTCVCSSISHVQGSTRINEPAFVNIWNLLDILQYCGDRGTYDQRNGCNRTYLTTLELCSPQSILLFIEELLDSQSIEGCRIVFNFLESRREAIIAVGPSYSSQ